MDNAKELLEIFGEHGVCETGQRWLRLQKLDINTLIHVWRRWPEYLFEHYDFAIGVLRSKLTEEDKSLLANEMLYVDWNGSVDGIQFPHVPIYLLGTSDVSISFDDFGTARIYCFGESRLHVNGNETCRLTIDLIGNSQVEVTGGMNATVYSYGNNIVEGTANVKKKEYVKGKVFNGADLPGDNDQSTW